MTAEKKKEKTVTDLSSLDVVKSSNEGAEFELVHPVTGKGLGIFISVLGNDSDTYRHAVEVRAQRTLRKSKKQRQQISLEEAENQAIEILAACTIGWTGLVENGKEIPFSESNARALYKKYPWMKDQVDAAIGDRALFLGE